MYMFIKYTMSGLDLRFELRRVVNKTELGSLFIFYYFNFICEIMRYFSV